MDRVQKWKAENRAADLAHKKGWRDRQRVKRDAIREAVNAVTKEVTT